MNRWVWMCALALGTAACRPQPPQEQTFTHEVDPSLAPTVASVADPSGEAVPVVAVADADGVVSEALLTEVTVTPHGDRDLEAFVARVGGTVLRDDAVPEPPAGVQLAVPPSELAAVRYQVRLDPSSTSLKEVDALLTEHGLKGRHRVSSEQALQLMALVAEARRDGFDVSPVFVSRPAGVFGTEEAPQSDGSFFDAHTLSYFKRDVGARTGVGAAWSYLEHRGIVRRTRVAILDSGFWLDGSGAPMTSTPGTDLPAAPIQYNFFNKTRNAGGPGVNSCTGGSTCPWHGNNSAGIATGLVDNRGGVAGTGGTVADPMLFNIRTTSDQVEWAVRTARAWGADVISMSFGGECNTWCRLEREYVTDYYDTFKKARESGIVLVASAGNDNLDVGGKHIQPCSLGGVICVGALEDDTFDTRIGYSNYGSAVYVWAPTNIQTMPNGGSSGMLSQGGGTSASAPFVAGIAAMLKALNPGLDSVGVANALLNTGHKVDGPEVKRSVDALAAAISVGGPLAADSSEPNDTAETATWLAQTSAAAPEATVDLPARTLHTGADRDSYRFSLHEYSAVTVQLEYGRELTPLQFELIPVGPEAVAPESAKRTITPRGFVYTADMVAPGEYRLSLRGTAPQQYRLQLWTSLRPLGPDMFETNDVLADAFTAPEGAYSASLHTASDVDYYHIVPVPPTSKHVHYFALEGSDRAVNVDVFDTAGTLLDSRPNVKSVPRIEVPAERIIRITGTGARTRYRFASDLTLSSSELGALSTIATDFWWLAPGNARPGWISDQPGWFVFTYTPNTTTVVLDGGGIGLELIDTSSHVVAQGTPKPESEQSPGMVLSLGALTDGAPYALRLTRLPEADAPATPEATETSPLGFTLTVR